MKEQFRFVGTLADVGGVRLDRFGQPVEMDLELALHPRGPAVIPEETFEQIGFTPEELERYQYAGPRINAPAEFQAKYRQALAAVDQFRSGGVQ